MGDFTLDIPEVQVLVNFPGDPDGFNWHHRVLLHRVEQGTWLTLSPDHEICRHNLAVVPHRVLERRSAFPADIADEVYAHDPIGKAALLAFKRTAKIQASILGEGEVEDNESFKWLVSETNHDRFGEEIDEGLLQNEATGFAFSLKGVVLLDGNEAYVEKVYDKDYETWKRAKGLEMGDQRLLGDHKDAVGKRKLDLTTAVTLMKGSSTGDDPEFPIQGVHAARELHEAVASGSQNFLAYHEQWLRLSGVGKKSSAAHIHRNLSESLKIMHDFDQIDCTTTGLGEHLSRWMVQTELAVERNPGAPDYTGLDIVGGSALLGDGRAATSKFSEWVSSKMRERAQIWKQERLFNQEKRFMKGKGKGSRGDEEDDDDASWKKKKKKKGGKPDSGGGNDPPRTG